MKIKPEQRPMRPTAKCRHCGQTLYQLLSGHWADGEGWFRCMKNVNHEPMPEKESR